MKKFIILFLIITNLFSDYNDMTINDFVNIVATQNSINIATDKSIEKNFNFYINKKIASDTNLEVLNQLLDQNGYVLKKQNKDFYIIKSKDDLLINKIDIYDLKYVKSSLVKTQADEILRGYYKNVKTTKTSNQQKEFTPLDERKTNNNSNVLVQETEEKINYSINTLNDKSIAVTYKDDFVPSIVQKIINTMDIEPTRIKVKVKIYEVKTDALKQYSSELNANLKLGPLSLSSGTNSQTGLVNMGASVSSTENSSSSLDINSIITALEKTGDAKVTAEPSVFIYEGNSAKLTEGKTYPIKTEDTTVTNNSTTSTSNYTNQDTGLILDLNFEQYRAGMIYLKLNLNIDLVEDYNQDKNQIITVKRELKTNLIIEPDTQVDMAGLNQKVISNSEGGIPILRSLPFVGKLFEFENSSTDESMLIIQLIVSVVRKDMNYKGVWRENEKTASQKDQVKKDVL
ncbi:MAG: hypothetical protein IE890_09770 [Arcobacter sp.]|nr:hypothetical protein [Arcobacter sp.]